VAIAALDDALARLYDDEERDVVVDFLPVGTNLRRKLSLIAEHILCARGIR
jgi:hypothetical protein